MDFLDIKKATKDELNKFVQKFAITTFGANFKFRPKQKETVVDIIYNWFVVSTTNDIVLSAPTGSGKSYIAMIVGGVLSKYYGLSGYVLISDLSLLKQYQNDLEMFLPEWAVIRGQQTYTCLANGFSFNSGVCKLQNSKSYNDIKVNFSDCAPYCEYILARDKAIEARMTVCTYPFWLLQQNYVRKKLQQKNEDACVSFDKRDFVICDEAHKLLEIVQSNFSPKFRKEDMTKIDLIINNLPQKYLKKNISNIREKIKHTPSDNTSIIHEDLIKYVSYLNSINSEISTIKNKFSVKDKYDITKEDRQLIYACDFFTDHYSKFYEFVNAINYLGHDNIIKNDSDLDKDKITFNCMNESYLMNSSFHINCNKKMYMSATIGDHDVFASSIACKSHYYIELPSTFDYTKSPIYFVNEFKMSYNEKDTSFPRITEMVHAILEMYKDKRGIIQTGSYTFAKKLFDMLPNSDKKRILLYDDSRTKNDRLEDFAFDENKVLVGPSLIEGLSLNDDLCRFQIIIKVPYPSLADKYVSLKNKFNPSWYTNTTAISMLQGIGRGVRSADDWCITFILDACFSSLFTKTHKVFPQDFKQRIQVIPSSSILSNI